MRAKQPPIAMSECMLALEETGALMPRRLFEPTTNDRTGMRLSSTRSKAKALADGVRRLEQAKRCYLHR
jgi:DNA-binding transcriptional MocR family regulator